MLSTAKAFVSKDPQKQVLSVGMDPQVASEANTRRRKTPQQRWALVFKDSEWDSHSVAKVLKSNRPLSVKTVNGTVKPEMQI